MGQDFGGEDLSRAIYLLLCLFIVVVGLRGMSRRAPRDEQSSPPRGGLRGWMDAHPWAVGGAVWASIFWGMLAARLWWLGEPDPAWPTLPLAVLAGLCIGWLLSLIGDRRAGP